MKHKFSLWYNFILPILNKIVGKKWIPCSKRLPNDSDYYLVTDGYGDVSVIWFAHEKDYYGKSEWRETEDEILAWMPLPECYRGDENVK